MKKIAHKTLLSLLALSAFESALALDSGAQTLTSAIGATDYFKINCAGDTDHLNFQLFENALAETSPVVTATEESQVLPQLLNAKLTKDKLNASISKLIAGTAKEISLKGGSGAYSLKIDTQGTNSVLKNSQTYTFSYQCLNAAGKAISKSSTTPNYTLANGSTKTFKIACSKKDSNSLKIKITNKTAIAKSKSAALAIETPASGNLMAQIVANRRDGAVAFNTIGDVLDVKSGNGDYFLMVNSPINAAKNYRFQYSCLSASNIETQTSLIQVLQDQ